MFEGCTSLESIPEKTSSEEEHQGYRGFGTLHRGYEAHDRTGRDPHPDDRPEGRIEPVQELYVADLPYRPGSSTTSPAVTTLASLFYGCSALTSVPAGIFDKQTAVTTVSSCFYGCSALRELPDGLFDKQTGTTNISSLFRAAARSSRYPPGSSTASRRQPTWPTSSAAARLAEEPARGSLLKADGRNTGRIPL